jgi:hypothetical protein
MLFFTQSCYKAHDCWLLCCISFLWPVSSYILPLPPSQMPPYSLYSATTFDKSPGGNRVPFWTHHCCEPQYSQTLHSHITLTVISLVKRPTRGLPKAISYQENNKKNQMFSISSFSSLTCPSLHYRSGVSKMWGKTQPDTLYNKAANQTCYGDIYYIKGVFVEHKLWWPSHSTTGL